MHRRLGQQHRQFVVDNENVNNHRPTIIQTYSGALAGTPVPACRNSCFIDPGFSGSIKHLEPYTTIESVGAS
jgi:hypothetical protein